MNERIIFQNRQGLKLVGVLHTPAEKTTKVVVMSHGFTSNKDRDRAVKIAEAFAQAGYAAFRFDFGGCGESDERPITIKDQLDDLHAAIAFVKERGFTTLCLYGESLGGLCSVLCYTPEIKILILSAPVTAGKEPTLIKNDEFGNNLEGQGFIIHKKDEKQFKISQAYFTERAAINQEEILTKIQCPVLIIHGTADTTILLSQSEEAMPYLPKESKLEKIEGGNHRLDQHTDTTISICLEWLKKYLI